MTALPAILYTAGFLTGGVTIRRAATWKGERTGWLMLIFSLGLLMSLVIQ